MTYKSDSDDENHNVKPKFNVVPWNNKRNKNRNRRKNYDNYHNKHHRNYNYDNGYDKRNYNNRDYNKRKNFYKRYLNQESRNFLDRKAKKCIFNNINDYHFRNSLNYKEFDFYTKRKNYYNSRNYHEKDDNNYRKNKKNNYKRNKNKKNNVKREINDNQDLDNKVKNVVIELNTDFKQIPIKNFPFKELLQSNFEKIEKDKMKEKEEEDNESIIIDSDDEIEEIDMKIESIKDLIKLGKLYKKKSDKKYSINLKKLNNLVVPLTKLDKAIGMDTIKKTIIDQIVYILQNFDKEEEMLHTVIEGPPGVGKTMLGQILGEIYYNLGSIKKKKINDSPKQNNPLLALFESSIPNNKKKVSNKDEKFPFKIVRRSDLIGQYLGQTAQKTQDAIDEANGGVLFIDEAYSLGSEDLKDSYAKECIDTINQNLSENKGNFVCIIAGYPKELEKFFFSQNRGLERRFVFRYKIDKYSPSELYEILITKIEKSGWKICDNFKDSKETIIKLIEKEKDQFKNYGGDIETFFLKCKISHSNRVFGKHPKLRKKLSKDDFLNGLNLYLDNKKRQEKNNYPLMMYT